MNIEQFCETLSEGLDMDHVTSETRISDFDSMQIIMMIATVHENFDHQLEANEIENAPTVNDIYGLVVNS